MIQKNQDTEKLNFDTNYKTKYIRLPDSALMSVIKDGGSMSVSVLQCLRWKSPAD